MFPLDTSHRSPSHNMETIYCPSTEASWGKRCHFSEKTFTFQFSNSVNSRHLRQTLLWQWTAATMASAVARPARTQTPASRVCSPLARDPHLFVFMLACELLELWTFSVLTLICNLRWPRGKSCTAFPFRLAGVAHSAFEALPAIHK